ncbi:hypothetical protein HanIR_Chr07g0311151 [Helianthus annuus]|nr:hypothetical protein HanIR_Chr07g0311151 [Helianthus annuus]
MPKFPLILVILSSTPSTDSSHFITTVSILSLIQPTLCNMEADSHVKKSTETEITFKMTFSDLMYSNMMSSKKHTYMY